MSFESPGVTIQAIGAYYCILVEERRRTRIVGDTENPHIPPVGGGLGKKTLRCQHYECHAWIVSQANWYDLLKAHRTLSAIIG
jgi:hypothetical protein